ncbi:MAG TPA: hypothetical protein VMX55_09375 [candidate division Zixibacteria bacterium]|nr:hypothetical protein [candidate division Zixibacteria bacterium]
MFKGIFQQPKEPALCPYCERPVERPVTRMTTLGGRMYSCPHCNKILGFSDQD